MTSHTVDRNVQIPVLTSLRGTLSVPDKAKAIVLFAHGRETRSTSPLSRYIASILNHAGVATLLFDLSTSDEENVDAHTSNLQLDFGLETERIVGAVDWVRNNSELQKLTIGVLGMGSVTAANLVAATERDDVGAVVCCGGRPDLAGDYIREVEAPTLFLVGGLDDSLIKRVREYVVQKPSAYEVFVVEGATHSFEEQGTLEKAAEVALGWYMDHLT